MVEEQAHDLSSLGNPFREFLRGKLSQGSLDVIFLGHDSDLPELIQGVLEGFWIEPVFGPKPMLSISTISLPTVISSWEWSFNPSRTLGLIIFHSSILANHFLPKPVSFRKSSSPAISFGRN